MCDVQEVTRTVAYRVYLNEGGKDSEANYLKAEEALQHYCHRVGFGGEREVLDNILDDIPPSVRFHGQQDNGLAILVGSICGVH